MPCTPWLLVVGVGVEEEEAHRHRRRASVACLLTSYQRRSDKLDGGAQCYL